MADHTTLIRQIRRSAARFEKDLATDPSFAYNIADAQNRLLRKIADELEQKQNKENTDGLQREDKAGDK